MIKRDFGKNIKKFRTDMMITQEELADYVGVTKQCVSSWETNRTQPNSAQVVIMANLFRCSVGDLVDGLSAGTDAMEVIERRLKDLDLRALFAVRDYINYLIVKNGGDPNDN